MITISITNLFFAILLIALGTIIVIMLRRQNQIVSMIKQDPPRYNSQEGRKIIDALETPQFGYGSILVLVQKQSELLAELGRTQAEIDHRINKIQEDLNTAKSLATSGWKTNREEQG